MKAKLIIDGCEVDIGIDLISNIASSLADDKNYQEVFHILAQSKSANIRQEIAYKDNITEETATLLLEDKDTSVLERMVRNDVAKGIINDEILDSIIQRANEEVLKEIANNFDGYSNVSIEKTAKKLVELNNLTITLAVAENYSTPKKALKALLKHSDPDIARAAQRSLD